MKPSATPRDERISYEEQLRRWAAGESIHAEQCCPDFSCCEPELKAPDAERLLFLNRPELRERLCMGYLGRAMALLGKDKDVYIAGSIEGNA